MLDASRFTRLVSPSSLSGLFCCFLVSLSLVHFSFYPLPRASRFFSFSLQLLIFTSSPFSFPPPSGFSFFPLPPVSYFSLSLRRLISPLPRASYFSLSLALFISPLPSGTSFFLPLGPLVFPCPSRPSFPPLFQACYFPLLPDACRFPLFLALLRFVLSLGFLVFFPLPQAACFPSLPLF